MHLVEIPNSVAITSDAARVTKDGPGMIIGTLTVVVTTSGISIVTISDDVGGANAKTVLTGTFGGPQTVNIVLNAVSRKAGWRIGTTTNVRCLVTTPRPIS